jgi:hypothetical protein
MAPPNPRRRGSRVDERGPLESFVTRHFLFFHPGFSARRTGSAQLYNTIKKVALSN